MSSYVNVFHTKTLVTTASSRTGTEYMMDMVMLSRCTFSTAPTARTPEACLRKRGRSRVSVRACNGRRWEVPGDPRKQ